MKIKCSAVKTVTKASIHIALILLSELCQNLSGNVLNVEFVRIVVLRKLAVAPRVDGTIITHFVIVVISSGKKVSVVQCAAKQ